MIYSSTNRLLFLLKIVSFNFIFLRADDQIVYPVHWRTAPSSIDDFPLIDSYRLIDPWIYTSRLGLFKILIDRTTSRMPFCLTSNASNILFALPSQFSWQFESNRLFTNGTMNISTDSWWASANYYLAVVPFLTAVRIGFIDSRNDFLIVKRENFCSTYDECFEQVPRAVQAWTRFFEALELKHKNFDEQIIDEFYLAPMWSAYRSSIESALPLVESKISLLPSSTERIFGLGWSRMIRLISLTRKNTNLSETLKNQRSFLPRRILIEQDRSICLSSSNVDHDLPATVRKSLKLLFSFRFDRIRLIEQIWQKITCNYQGRIDAQKILESLGRSKFVALIYFGRALVKTVLVQCDRTIQFDL